MGSLKENLLLVNANGEELDIDELIQKYQKDEKRVLADDEIGIVLYTADLEIFSLEISPDNIVIPKKVNQLKRSRFGTPLIRLQIGAMVASYSADTIFLVKKEDYIVKVRADKLEKGMILVTNEKVY